MKRHQRNGCCCRDCKHNITCRSKDILFLHCLLDFVPVLVLIILDFHFLSSFPFSLIDFSSWLTSCFSLSLSFAFLDLYSSIINHHQPSTINHQPSATNHHLSIIKHQPSILLLYIKHQSSITNHHRPLSSLES